MQLLRIFSRTILLVLLLFLAGCAGNNGIQTESDEEKFDKGLAAFQSGDYATTLKKFRPIAEQGDVIAQFMLGSMYYEGQGVTQDYQAAFNWFKLAAEQENVEGFIQGFGKHLQEETIGYARYYLGLMYLEGKGVTLDYKAAFKWFKLAAEKGDAKGQNFLGVMYYEGKGVAQDKTRGHMWLNVAASRGDKSAVQTLSRVDQAATPDDVSKAYNLARECEGNGFKNC